MIATMVAVGTVYTMVDTIEAADTMIANIETMIDAMIATIETTGTMIDAMAAVGTVDTMIDTIETVDTMV